MLAVRRLAILAAVVPALVACARPAAAPALPTPPERWGAPLPHGGEPAALAQWWSAFGDAQLTELVARAQQRHPTVALAVARIDESRALLRAARAGLLPQANATAQASRAATLSPALTYASQVSVGADARWEIDLFGATRQAVAAQQARADAARLAWHDARVSLAAETAQAYAALRGCEALLSVLEQEAQSQKRTAELTAAKVRVGFEAPSLGALADAGAAEAANRVIAQRADCDLGVQALATLTGDDAPALRTRLVPGQATLPQPPPFVPQALPAQALAQRPDLAVAERDLAAAVAEQSAAEAERWPQLAINGSIGLAALRTGGSSFDGLTFGFGPALVLPVFDGGRRAALADAAAARVEQARAGYELRLRLAVREVEDALLRLDAASRREADARRAAQGFRAFYDAAQTRWRVGAGSLIDMEDARRTALAAQAGLIGVQRERVAAWIALYKAAGGGWQAGAEGPRDELGRR